MLLDGGHWSVYLVDLETGAVEEMTHRFNGQEFRTAVTVEVDWPAVFSS